MLITKELRRQIWKAGYTNSFWGWSAIAQLPGLLEDDEVIEKITSGLYDAGHAVLIATNKRMIFMDKKVMSFRVEDIHYQMISEVEHRTGFIMAKLRIRCLSNEINLSSLSQKTVREFARYVDTKVNNMRLNMRSWDEILESANQGSNNSSYLRPMTSRRRDALASYANFKRP